MTRWLQAARSAKPTKDKTDTTDKTKNPPVNTGSGTVLQAPTKPHQTDVLSVKLASDLSVSSVMAVSSVTSFLSGGVLDATPPSTLAASRQTPLRHGLDPDGLTAHKVARLPSHPPTCAICEVQSWTVAMTDRDGRKLHVSCWKGESQ